MNGSPRSRIITVHTFRGDRTATFRKYLFKALDDEENGRGPGPSETECLLFAGHTGLSVGVDGTILGFHPDSGTDPVWRILQRLQAGRAYPGLIRDDTAVFTAASQRGLTILTFDIVLSMKSYRAFRRKLTVERQSSRFAYSFPNGDGDCNCTTWIERLGVPLLTGQMEEFVFVTGVAAQIRRRFEV